MNYTELVTAVSDYTENTFPTANMNTFIEQAEQRIYNTVQFPSLRKNVTGTTSPSNKYLACPDDFLSSYSMAVVDATGNYSYLLNKDVNFIRESYPNPTYTGTPKYYALFGSQLSFPNELSFILGPTPDESYNAELHYFYYPPSIVKGIITSFLLTNAGTGYVNGIYYNVPLTDGNGTGAVADITISGNTITNFDLVNGGSLYQVGDTLSAPASSLGGTSTTTFFITVLNVNNATGTSWLGDNYSPVLLYGSLMEAYTFMKGEQDVIADYTNKYQQALAQLKRLGDGLERNDAYRKGQTSLPYNQL